MSPIPTLAGIYSLCPSARLLVQLRKGGWFATFEPLFVGFKRGHNFITTVILCVFPFCCSQVWPTTLTLGRQFTTRLSLTQSLFPAHGVACTSSSDWWSSRACDQTRWERFCKVEFRVQFTRCVMFCPRVWVFHNTFRIQCSFSWKLCCRCSDCAWFALKILESCVCVVSHYVFVCKSQAAVDVSCVSIDWS